jgi:futalosine hydrolase
MDKTGVFTKRSHRYRYGSLDIDVLISGVGVAAMAYHLGRQLGEQRYDLAINAGIAGAIDHSLVPGTVVLVTEERFPDLGAEDNGNIISVFDLGLVPCDQIPYSNGVLKAPSITDRFPLLSPLLAGLPQTKGLTSDTITGNNDTLFRLQQFSDAGVETMEGAPFFFGCISDDLPCLALRAISNLAGERNKARWKTSLAIEQLNNKLLQILDLL